MNIETFNNKKYNIENNLILKIKNITTNRPKLYKFDAEDGFFNFQVNVSSKFKDISLYRPDFVSQIYSSNPIITENNLDYIQIITSSNNLKNKLNKVKYDCELFDNGILIKRKNAKIHLAYFLNKVVGLSVL